MKPVIGTPFKLNRNSPLARGLVHWLPNAGRPGTTIHTDYVLQESYGYDGTTPIWLPNDRFGYALYFDGADRMYTTGTPITGSPFTILFWAKPTNLSSSRYWLGVGDSSVGNYYFALGINDTPRLFSLSIDGGTPQIAQANTDVIIDTWHLLGATVSTGLTLYTNGVSDGTGSYVGSTGWDRLSIGTTPDATPANYTLGYISDVMYWNRALSNAEVWSLYSNPWQLYEPLVLPKYWGVAFEAPTEPVITPSEVSIALAVDNVELTVYGDDRLPIQHVLRTADYPHPGIFW